MFPCETLAVDSLFTVALLFQLVRWIIVCLGIVALWFLLGGYRRTRNLGFVALLISAVEAILTLGFLPFLYSKAVGSDAKWQTAEISGFFLFGTLTTVGISLVSTGPKADSKGSANKAILEHLYLQGWVLIIYGLSGVFLLLGVLSGNLTWFILAIMMFTVWDLGWLFGGVVVRSRSAFEILESAMRARTYMSWFLSVYGAVLAFFLFQATTGARENFFALCYAANVKPALFSVPFALTGITLLFYMIGLSDTSGTDLKTRNPSNANVGVLVMTAWAQKVTTYSFLYSVLRLLYYVWKYPAVTAA